VRWLPFTLGIAFVAYLALVTYVYVSQASLVYFPSRELSASPANIGLAFEEARIESSDGVKLHAWYVPAAAGATTVLFCHGNAGNISHRLEWLKIFHDMGLAVLLFDYRGYGQSSGTPGEQGTYDDARAAWSYLTQTRNISPGRVVIFGESLGGAVATHLSRNISPAALIITSAFTSVPDLASKFYWYLPVRLIARIHYRTADYIAQVRAPALIIHSRDDEIVPFSHGEEIYRRANEPKQFLEISGDHNGGFLTSEAKLIEGLRTFLDRHSSHQPLRPSTHPVE
jgi:fermentation-respiration switch protein FrsA (DUF1100 family)